VKATKLRVKIASLREQIKQLFMLLEERQKQVGIAFEASQKANDKAETAQKTVNATQNEMRGMVTDMAGTLATKETTDLLAERISKLENVIASGIGRTSGAISVQQLLLQLVPIIVAVIAMIWSFRNGN